ncbi:unnamed protein product [Oncorhynchus mykiss]|uniref:Potassium channel tetramerisation-type BTB domain-containing protein n=1 Tax=Oncorhynchus mykiss TaxID=8022 RepID=A0A060YFY7_ONCMY|nr:unnamed protein product [Oncorhynchus mykiss]
MKPPRWRVPSPRRAATERRWAWVVCAHKYVRLNVGRTLFYTTLQVLTRQDSVLKAMFSGRKEVFIDREGWVLIDRSGKHFTFILMYLREEGGHLAPWQTGASRAAGRDKSLSHPGSGGAVPGRLAGQ